MTPEIFLQELLADAAAHLAATGRPLVTLAYAQSLDGSLAERRGRPLPLSGDQSLTFTHALRVASDAILVGIGTVLADDPQLTARREAGPDPQPVILDSRLRTPRHARLWDHPKPPWFFSGEPASHTGRALVEGRGGRLITVPADGGRLDLNAVLASLGEQGVTSLMVEGGAEVITSFLSSGLADRVAATIAPVYVGGLRMLERRLPGLPRLQRAASFQMGPDIVVVGRFGA